MVVSFCVADQGFRSRNAGEENWCSGSRLSSNADYRGPSSLLSVCSTHQSHAKSGTHTHTQIYPHGIPLWGFKGCFSPKSNIYTRVLRLFLCPQVLHHMNEVGDHLCLKFSRLKYSSCPNLHDEKDFELGSWYDPWHLHLTVSKWSLVSMPQQTHKRTTQSKKRGQMFSSCFLYVCKTLWLPVHLNEILYEQFKCFTSEYIYMRIHTLNYCTNNAGLVWNSSTVYSKISWVTYS